LLKEKESIYFQICYSFNDHIEMRFTRLAIDFNI